MYIINNIEKYLFTKKDNFEESKYYRSKVYI